MANAYTTISGDEWDGICYKHYGASGEMFMDKVIRANPQYMHFVVFPANVTLTMPAIEPQENNNADLPPWLR